MEESTIQTLNQQIIHDCLAGADGGKENLLAGYIIAFIFVILGFFVIRHIVFGPFCFAMALLLFFLARKGSSIAKSIAAGEYRIYKDICIKKGISYNSESLPTHYLIMERHGRIELSFPFLLLKSIAATSSPDLYKTSDPGDCFYLACTSKDKILYLFNKKFWNLETREFVLVNDDCYIPVKQQGR